MVKKLARHIYSDSAAKGSIVSGRVIQSGKFEDERKEKERSKLQDLNGGPGGGIYYSERL